MAEGTDSVISGVYRSDWGRILATVIRLTGDFNIAEEATQEAFEAALDRWRGDGVPVRRSRSHRDAGASARRAHRHLPRLHRGVRRHPRGFDVADRSLYGSDPPGAGRSRPFGFRTSERGDRAPRAHASARRPARRAA